MSATKPRVSRTTRIKAGKAAKHVPTAILLKKKAECDAKALKIVERLMEPQVDIEWMLQNLGAINRAHLEDIVEERAIVKLCGYILCENSLTKVVRKKYQISTARNKVYDIEKVKDFCSFSCYTAMGHLMAQMLTSPLWLRSDEEIPEFSILPRQRARTKSPPGVEVNIVGLELPVDDDQPVDTKEKNRADEAEEEELNPAEVNNTCDTDMEMENNVLHEVDQKVEDEEIEQAHPDVVQEDKAFDLKPEDDLQLQNNSISLPEIESRLQEIEIASSEDGKIQSKRKGTSGETCETSESIQTSRKVSPERKKCKTKPEISLETLTMRVEKSFTEWITKETIGLLHGEVIDKQQIIENVTRQDKYMALCRKLNQLQLEEEKEERSSVVQSEDLKPPPHFSVLKEEARNLEVKVRAFYEGKTKLETPVEDTNKNADNQEADSIVPLTDAHAPRALRRRIFLDKLNKVLPDLLRALAGSGRVQYAYTTERTTTVKTLVSTFALSATNIVFKTAEWTLVALLIIKMLGIIDPTIKSLLLTKQATTYMTMILMTYKLDSNYLDCLINSLTSPPINNDGESNDEDD